MSSGRNKYIPRIVIEEVEDIKRSENIKVDALAFRKMVEHSRVGREVEKIVSFDFRLPPLSTKGIWRKKK